jgi:hypothetical protein
VFEYADKDGKINYEFMLFCPEYPPYIVELREIAEIALHSNIKHLDSSYQIPSKGCLKEYSDVEVKFFGSPVENEEMTSRLLKKELA